MRIDNVTLRRIIKEELNNVMKGINVPDPSSALDEAMSLQQEGLSGILAAFAAALSINTAEIPDNAKFNVNGNSVTIEQIATAYDMLEKVSQNPEMSKYAELGQDDLVDIVEDSLARGDSDGDGIYGGQNSLKDMQSANAHYEFGEAYADMALDRVLEKSQAGAPSADAEQPETTRSASSTNADAIVKMLEIQPNKAEAAEKAKFLLQKIESGNAGVKATGDTVERLKAIANQ